MELQGRVEELARNGLGLAAISYDPPELLEAFSRQHGITFPLLADVGSATIKHYGIANPAAKGGVPFPGTFMLDRDGRITSRFFEESYLERNTASSLMLKLGVGAAPVNATRISTAHLDATTYASDAAVAPGNRITMTLDVVPRPGMHVYAPGATGYRVIRLELDPQPFARMMPIVYPASELYFFAPLEERVPVYQKPFTVRRDVVIEGTPEARAALEGKESVTLTGRLEYQACDDKVCFNPVSLPLTWTMSLRPLVTARPASPPR